MEKETMGPRPHHRGMAGEDAPALKPQGVLQPIMEKVAVPVMWFGIGYLACMILSKRKGP